MFKWILRLFLLLVILVVGLVVAVWFLVGARINGAIAGAASSALGVPTTLGGVGLSPFAGKASLSELDISNPDGFEGSFLVLNEGSIELDLGSLFSDVVRVRDVSLSGFEMDLHQKLGGSNVKKILDNVNRSVDRGDGGGDTDSEGGTRVAIDRFSMRDITVRVQVEPLTTDPTTITIPEVVLTKLGADGAPMKEVVAEVIAALSQAVVDAGGTRIPSELLGAMRGGLDGLRGKLDFDSLQVDLGDGLKDITGELGGGLLDGAAGDAVNDAIDDAAGRLGEGLRGILGGDDDG